MDLGDAPVSRRVGRCYLLTLPPTKPCGHREGDTARVSWVVSLQTLDAPNLSRHRFLRTHDGVSGEKGGWDRPPRVLRVAQRGGNPQATAPPGCGAQKGATVLQAVPKSKTQEPQLQYKPPG